MFFKPLLLPLLAQVLLTFLVWFYLFARRIPEILKKDIDVRKLKDRTEAHSLMPDSSAALIFLSTAQALFPPNGPAM